MTEQKQVATTSESRHTEFNFLDPLQFETMQRACTLFASSDLVPDNYQISEKNPKQKAIANCMIAIEMSQRIGASPLMIMQNMAIIYGKPSWSSKFLIATVNSCGRFEPLKYKFTEKGMLGMVDYTEYVWNSGRKVAKQSQFDGQKMMEIECVAWTKAKGTDVVLESSPITLGIAIKEGWYTKAGSKWKTMPKQMLMYRAASFWTSAYAPELSMGMSTKEEVIDIQDVPFEEIPIDEKVALTINKEANKESISMDVQEKPKDVTPQKVEEKKKTSAPEPEGPGY